MRISDWSSDGCSSDLLVAVGDLIGRAEYRDDRHDAGNRQRLGERQHAAGDRVGGRVLEDAVVEQLADAEWRDDALHPDGGLSGGDRVLVRHPCRCGGDKSVRRKVGDARSEEHTSELQSLMRNSYAGFCLKKKTTTYNL